MAELSVVKMEKSKPVCMPEKCGLAEHRRHDWVVDVDLKLTLDEVLEPGYWAHLTSNFPIDPLDKIECRWEDGSRIVHLRVLYSERTFAKVKVISVEELGTVSINAPDLSKNHDVEWKGPVLKYCVIRKDAERTIVHEKCRTKEEAYAWMSEHEKK